MFTSEAYKIQDNKKIDGQTITDGELVVKAQYICSMQVDTKWYCNQHPQQHVSTVPTGTILHALLEVNSVTYFHDKPKVYVTGHKKKNFISRHPICLTDYYYIEGCVACISNEYYMYLLLIYI